MSLAEGQTTALEQAAKDKKSKTFTSELIGDGMRNVGQETTVIRADVIKFNLETIDSLRLQASRL